MQQEGSELHSSALPAAVHLGGLGFGAAWSIGRCWYPPERGHAGGVGCFGVCKALVEGRGALGCRSISGGFKGAGMGVPGTSFPVPKLWKQKPSAVLLRFLGIAANLVCQRRLMNFQLNYKLFSSKLWMHFLC